MRLWIKRNRARADENPSIFIIIVIFIQKVYILMYKRSWSWWDFLVSTTIIVWFWLEFPHKKWGAAPLEGVLNVNFAQIFCCCPYHDITTTRPRHITMCFALSHIRIRRHTHSRFVESTVCPYSSISDISYVHVQYSAVVKRNKISKHNWIVTSNLS